LLAGCIYSFFDKIDSIDLTLVALIVVAYPNGGSYSCRAKQKASSESEAESIALTYISENFS
jgi:hypothetical protein